jgi:hypothetical protein
LSGSPRARSTDSGRSKVASRKVVSIYRRQVALQAMPLGFYGSCT